MPVDRSRAIIVFLKHPDSPDVKTRLARTVGKTRARSIYQKLVLHTLTHAGKLNADIYLHYAERIDENLQGPANIAGRYIQEGKDLGERMAYALASTLDHYQSAILIGSDCGELTASILEEAFDSLEFAEVTLGPSVDGGYYLVGMCESHPSIFRDIEWSTPTVLRDTIRRLIDEHLSFKLLAELRDVDYEDDWRALQWSENS